jgi:hypothetical protein
MTVVQSSLELFALTLKHINVVVAEMGLLLCKKKMPNNFRRLKASLRKAQCSPLRAFEEGEATSRPGTIHVNAFVRRTPVERFMRRIVPSAERKCFQLS